MDRKKSYMSAYSNFSDNRVQPELVRHIRKTIQKLKANNEALEDLKEEQYHMENLLQEKEDQIRQLEKLLSNNSASRHNPFSRSEVW